MNRGAIAVAVFLFCLGLVHLTTLDGLPGILCLRPNTQYAPGYSDSAFRRIKLGMAKPDVLAELGEPLMTHVSEIGDREELLTYSTFRKKGDSYRLRAVVLANNQVRVIANECSED